MKKKLISIIVPVYNVEDYIEECVNSILNQSVDCYELLLIDDGSKDSSGKIIDNYKKNKNVRIIHKENGGLSDARNCGITEATGEYLMFVDGDDYLLDNNCLAQIISAIKSNNSDILQYKMAEFYQNKNKYIYKKDLLSIENENIIDALQKLNREGQVSVSACDKIIKRSLIADNDLYFEKGLVCEDVHWSYNLYQKTKSITTVNLNIYAYRKQRKGSISSEKNKKLSRDLFYIINSWYDYDYKDEKTKEVFHHMIAYWYSILRANFSSKCYTKEMKLKFKEYDETLLSKDDNYKVKKVRKFQKLFGINITVVLMKIYIFIKDRGIKKL